MPPGHGSVTERAARQAVEALAGSFIRGAPGDRGALDAAYARAIRLVLYRTAADLSRRHGPETPHKILSSLYEHLLRYSPRRDPVIGDLKLVQDRQRRKATGCFYTPRHIARQVVEESLRALPDVPAPTVLDPAMGTGVFLHEAIEQIAESNRSLSRAEIAERCIFGVDSDPMAVDVAVLSLWLETGARPAVLRRHLRCRDALSVAPTEQFDVVVGNPPWGAPYNREEQDELRRRFPRSTKGTFDSFKLFLDLGERATRGAVGMVVPQAMLCQEKHADAREILLETMAPYYVAELPSSFAGVAAPAAVVVFGPKPGPGAVPVAGHGEANRRARATGWTATSGFRTAELPALRILTRLQETHPRLGDGGCPFRIRDVGINYNRASVAEKIFYQGAEREHPDDMPRFRGRDFNRYGLVGSSGWLRHDPRRLLEGDEEMSLSMDTYALPEKIVFRQTADCIVATLDRSRSAMGRSVIAVTAEGQASLRALLACLNSGLVTALYRALAGEEGRILPQVKVGRMSALPVPEPALRPVAEQLLQRARALIESGDERAILHASRDPELAWACLECLGERLLEVRGEDRATSALVEAIVVQLYGLRPDEVAALGLGSGRTV